MNEEDCMIDSVGLLSARLEQLVNQAEQYERLVADAETGRDADLIPAVWYLLHRMYSSALGHMETPLLRRLRENEELCGPDSTVSSGGCSPNQADPSLKHEDRCYAIAIRIAAYEWARSLRSDIDFFWAAKRPLAPRNYPGSPPATSDSYTRDFRIFERGHLPSSPEIDVLYDEFQLAQMDIFAKREKIRERRSMPLARTLGRTRLDQEEQKLNQQEAAIRRRYERKLYEILLPQWQVAGSRYEKEFAEGLRLLESAMGHDA